MNFKECKFLALKKIKTIVCEQKRFSNTIKRFRNFCDQVNEKLMILKEIIEV
jgi:hypothetical protein